MSLPPDYAAHRVGEATLVAHREWAEPLRAAIERGGDATLYGYAERCDDRRTLVGRAVAYAVALPGRTERVVVRHNRHGGALARLTGDRFLAPTRAPDELSASARLASERVPTPLVVGFATYAAGPLMRRADVVTLEVPQSRDLSHVFTQDDDMARIAALEATAVLVAQLARARARHHDLNVKNVLLADGAAEPTAYVLDVDRVQFTKDEPARTLELNLARLLRSARKWRERWGATIAERELDALAYRARDLLATWPRV